MKINPKYPIAILSASVIAIFGIKAEEGYRAKPYHDIGKDLMFFDRSLSPDELTSASIEVVKKVKPEVLQ